MEPITFKQAMEETRGARRNLLIGNGFSASRHPEFGYATLFKYAARQDPPFADLFPNPGNPNFEDAMRRAATAGEVDRIREALIKAIAAVHPHYVLDLKDWERRACRRFLEQFIGRELPQPGWLFSTNYDLLLHWVLSTQESSPGVKQHKQLIWHDGFDGQGDWHKFAPTSVYYLHGAVHIFERPYNALALKFATEMIRYERSKTWLMTQVAERMGKGERPVFIAEATGDDKRRSIGNYDYTARARRQFRKALEEPNASLFTFGQGFGESDSHITDEVVRGHSAAAYLGVYSLGDRARAEALAVEWAEARHSLGKPEITVRLYDVKTCTVWGDPTTSDNDASPV